MPSEVDGVAIVAGTVAANGKELALALASSAIPLWIVCQPRRGSAKPESVG
jgi:hypothetical protein